MRDVSRHVVWLDDLKRTDIAKVCGKNSSLGEIIQELVAKGIHVPLGFATTSDAYWHFVDENHLREPVSKRIADWTAGKTTLAETGMALRQLIFASRLAKKHGRGHSPSL